MRRFRAILGAALLGLASPVLAQGTQIAFGGPDFDRSAPVEVTADALSVDQSDGSAEFNGNVIVGQGALRLSAGSLRIEYATNTETNRTDVSRIIASGGVTVVTGAEAAEAAEAIYTLADARIVMEGEVIVTQGPNALSGDRLIVNLDTGAGQMEGRVRTVIRTNAE